MKYPAHFEADKENGGYVVTFRDVPEAITQGDTFDEAVCMARDVLESSINLYIRFNDPVPVPSNPQPGEHLIEIPEYLAEKVLSSEVHGN